MALAPEELEKRYRALGALPEFPGEREWVDRLRTFDDFREFGPELATDFAELLLEEPEEAERRRLMAPELYELLMVAFT